MRTDNQTYANRFTATSAQGTREGILIFSSLLALVELDEAALDLLGLTRVPRQWRQPCGLELMCTRDCLNRVKQGMGRVIDGTFPQVPLKIRLRQGKGKSLLCKGIISPVFAEQGSIIAVVLKFAPMGLGTAQEAGRPFFSRINDHQIVDRLPQGVFSIDTQWKIQGLNHRAEEMIGVNREDALGRYCWEVFQFDGCRNHCPFEKIFQGGSTREDHHMRVVCPNGMLKEFRAVASPLEDDQGVLVGGVQIFLPRASQPVLSKAAFMGMVGKSRGMQEIFHRLPDIAQSPSNVLITGESGTGKELIARAIHGLSRVKQGPFQAVNCSALAQTLLESELFGREKGAYTGADTTAPGRFELASGGSLFLDEIGEMDTALQVKLLRVLDQREFERVGANRAIPLQARIIAATHRDLELGQETGDFRRDLFYRLRTIPIHLPPLRERLEDLPLLVNHFIGRFNEKYGKSVRMLDPAVMKRFMAHDWPGNVRELERVMEHAFVFVKGPIIFPRNLPPKPRVRIGEIHGDQQGKNAQREAVLQALAQAGQKRARAAELLGISRSSLWRRMKQYGLLETAHHD